MPIHIHAQPGEVAPYVLLPGDPNRAKYIAEQFLDNPKQYSDHRLMLGFTGTYKGLPVSVQTTGMGCPTTAIVVEELHQLEARVLVRVGTTGAIVPHLHPADVVIAQAALPNDGTSRAYMGSGPHVPLPSFRVLRAAIESAEVSQAPWHTGLISSDDAFYASAPLDDLRRKGVIALEMEASALFTVGALRGMETACLLTVSNQVGDSSHIDGALMKKGVDRMVGIALETMVRLETHKPLLK